MQENHFTFLNSEEYASLTPSGKMNPYFPQVSFHLPHERHSQRPAKLNELNILPNRFAILLIQLHKPLANRLIIRIRTEEHNAKNWTIHT